MKDIKAKHLLDLIRSNKGFTATHKGTPVNYALGYIVSRAGFETSIELGSLNVEHIKRHAALAKQHDCNIGAWLDDNGIVYLDLSERIYDKALAFRYAVERKQKAIYNCKTKQVEVV